MSGIKPYTFWVVVGAVVAAELLVFLFTLSDIDVVGSLVEARQAKKELDKEYSHLKELDERAKRVLSGSFDAERPADIQQLVDQYLITPAWKPVLERQVEEYDRTFASIERYLAQRSLPLAAPIAETADKLEWYTAYQTRSAALLRAVHAEGRLDIARGDEAGVPDFADDAHVRDLLGLFTKAADYPEEGERPRITARFRVTEQVVAALRRAVPVAEPNPVVGAAVDGLPPARIGAWTWDAPRAEAQPGSAAELPAGAAAGRGDVPLAGPLARLATAWRLTLTLSGPLPSLLAAEAALEHGDPEGPPLVVTGLELRRKDQFRLGERKDVPAEDVRAQLTVLVLDFAPAGRSGAAAPSQPGTAGK